MRRAEARLETQVGGLSSLASQPSTFEFMGSLGMTVVLVWPHLGHSKVRMAEPQGRDPRLANSMRCCRQFGQPGRSIAETCGGDAGLNSGMMHCADLDSCGQESRHLKLHHGLFRVSGRGQKCSNRKISSAKGERTRAPHLILRFKYRLSVFATATNAISAACGCATSAQISRASYRCAVRI
jgi:hypothetical protein